MTTNALGLASMAAIITVFALGRWWEILTDRANAIPPADRRRIDSDYAQLVDRAVTVWWAFIAAIATSIILLALLVVAP